MNGPGLQGLRGPLDQLFDLAVRRIQKSSRGPQSLDATLEQCKGLVEIEIVALQGGSDCLQLFEGSLDGVVKAMARYEVHNVISREADLEDVFLDLYRDGGDSDA